LLHALDCRRKARSTTFPVLLDLLLVSWRIGDIHAGRAFLSRLVDVSLIIHHFTLYCGL
jgi:hypothetical protein